MLWDHFLPHRKKREDLEKNLDFIAEVRKKGAEKARAIAAVTMDRVRGLVGVK